MRNPPILIAVLGFFAALAGFAFLFFGLRALGFDWFGALGDLPALERVGLWGWLAIATGIVWLAAALGLWALQPWARLFAMIMAGLGLFEALLAFFQFPGTGYGLSLAIMPAVVLWYLSTTEVKEAFGLLPEPIATSQGSPEPANSPAAADVAPDAGADAPAAGLAVAAAGTMGSGPESTATFAPLGAAAVVPPMTATDTEPVPDAVATSSGPRLKVEDVEGIGAAYGAKLSAAGVRTTDQLLTTGATREGRERLAAATGISSQLILEWVNNADLMRIRGVGSEYSDLLEAAGVDSPAELAQRNAANLAETFQEVIAARPGTVRRVPTEAEVATWIDEARKLPRIVEH